MKNINCSPYIQQCLKKNANVKNLHNLCKKSKMDVLLVQNKVSFAGYVKNESVALSPGQLQAKFP